MRNVVSALLLLFCVSSHAFVVDAVVPIPAAAWLFGSALGMLVWVRKRSLNTQ